MNKLEFLSAQLPYGLKLMQSCKNWFTPEPDRVVLLVGMSEHDLKMPEQYGNTPCEPSVFYRVDDILTGNSHLSDFTPIIRPLDSLVKECSQADYNDGKPFVPMYELNKLFDYGDVRLTYFTNSGLGWAISGGFGNIAITSDMMTKPIQLLLKWHFWPNKPEGEEVIWVMSDFNPY